MQKLKKSGFSKRKIETQKSNKLIIRKLNNRMFKILAKKQSTEIKKNTIEMRNILKLIMIV